MKLWFLSRFHKKGKKLVHVRSFTFEHTFPRTVNTGNIQVVGFRHCSNFSVNAQFEEDSRRSTKTRSTDTSLSYCRSSSEWQRVIFTGTGSEETDLALDLSSNTPGSHVQVHITGAFTERDLFQLATVCCVARRSRGNEKKNASRRREGRGGGGGESQVRRGIIANSVERAHENGGKRSWAWQILRSARKSTSEPVPTANWNKRLDKKKSIYIYIYVYTSISM